MYSHFSLNSSSPSSSAPPIARSLSLKDRKVNLQSNTPNRSRFSLNLNLLLPSPSLNKVSIPTSLESQLNGEGGEGRCRIVGTTRKSRHARSAVPPSAMKHYDCSELCSSTEDEHDLVGGLSCFGSPKRKSQRTRSLSTRAYEKQPAGEEKCSPSRRIQQEWRAKNEVLTRARTRSYSTRQQLKVVTESLGSGSSSGACPPLPSPCEGLFESSRTASRPLSLTITLPAPTTAYTGQLLSLPPDPDSRNPEEQGLPVPLPLSPLLSPALSHFDTGCAGAATEQPPSPIVPPSSPFRTRESSCGHYSVDDDSWCHQSKHKRWISDSQSSDPCTASTCSNQDPRLSLSQDIESVINYAGQKLRKTSSPPKTWAEPRIVREDSVEDERCFGVGVGVAFKDGGGGGLTLPPMAVERLQTRRASSAVIVGVDGVEIVSDYHDGEEDEWFGRRTSEEDEEDAAASSSDSHVYVDAGTPRGEMGSGGGLKSRRSFLSRVKRSLNPLRPPARA